MNTAIVLAGGRGSRLKPITNKIPKALISVCSRPLIYWVTRWLIGNNIGNIIFGLAYKKKDVLNYLNKVGFSNANIQISEHSVNDGTATAVRKAIINCNLVNDDFLVMNGDNIADISIKDFYSYHLKGGRIATILAVPLQCNFGIIKLTGTKVVSFKEKTSLPDVLINGGIYIFNKKITPFLKYGDLEMVTFPELIQREELSGYKYNGFWITVNTLKDIEILESKFNEKTLSNIILKSSRYKRKNRI